MNHKGVDAWPLRSSTEIARSGAGNVNYLYVYHCRYTTYSLVSSCIASREIFPMVHKGIEYSVTLIAPGIWKWQFRIGDEVKTGKTETKLNLLAIRRVQLRIDRELKKAARQTAP